MAESANNTPLSQTSTCEVADGVENPLRDAPGAPTVCTIASSVSDLAVSEDSLPKVMTVPDQDTACCPPKKKCTLENVKERVQFISAEQLDQPAVTSFETDGVREGIDKRCKGDDPGIEVKLSVTDGFCAKTTKAESPHVDLSLTGHERKQSKLKTEQNVERFELTYEKILPRGYDKASRLQDSSSGTDGEFRNRGKPKLVDSEVQVSEVHKTLTPSPYHCYGFDSENKVAGMEKQLRVQSWGNPNQSEVQYNRIGDAGDASSSSHSTISSHKTEDRGLVLSPEFNFHEPTPTRCSVHGAGVVCCCGDTVKSESGYCTGNSSECISPATDCALKLGTESAAEWRKTTASSVRIDLTKFSISSPESLKANASSSGTFCPDTLFTQDAGACASTFNTDYGAYAPSTSNTFSTLTGSTDYETDTSGCSESSSEASTSSSDSCHDHSASSVSSTIISSLKLKCPSLPDTKLRRSKKDRKVKKKTPSYGLKTDAVDAVIGLRRSEYTKIKHIPSADSADHKEKAFYRAWKWGDVKTEDKLDKKGFITINDLPCVLLVHILSFLPLVTRIKQIRLVCKRWQLAALDPSLWRRLDMRNLPRLKDDMLLQLASMSDRVSTLILSDGRSTLLTDQGVSRALQQCPHLKKIKFNRCFFLSDDAFQTVGLSCHGLLCLSLSGCFTVTDRTLLAISKGCPQLQDLDVGQCAKITDEGVCAVAKGCPHLTRFRLDQCGKLTNSAVETVATHCPELQYLHLLSCALTDAGIHHLSKLGKLQVLDISNVSQLSPRMVETVTASCPGLETLAISLNRAVDDQCLRHIVTQCPKLRCLSCVACSLSDKGMHFIAQYAKNLERLDVAWCADITDAGIIEISAACPKLRYLGIMRCALITMATVEQLLLRHPSIQYSNFELDSRRLLGRAAEEGYRTEST